MAGHSQFKNIMHRKGAQDKKRAKLFTKLLREITVSAKSNQDPSSNPRLRSAILAARTANVPKDNIAKAISKSSSSASADNFEEIRYEGYGPGGIAIIVEALTDNRNRTASEVRSIFTKHGGALGETGSLSFLFTRVGLILYPIALGTADAFLEAAIEANGDDCFSSDTHHEITCKPDVLNEVRDALEKLFGPPDSASLTWKPNSLQIVSNDDAEKLLKMIDALDECDDVQNVIGNFELSDAALEKFANA